MYCRGLSVQSIYIIPQSVVPAKLPVLVDEPCQTYSVLGVSQDRLRHHSHIVLDISANQSKGHADVPNSQESAMVHRSNPSDRLLWF